MAKQTRKTTRKKPAIVADKETIQHAVKDLGLNRPYYTCRAVGARLEFTLYGGDLIYWPPTKAKPDDEGTPADESKPATKARS